MEEIIFRAPVYWFYYKFNTYYFYITTFLLQFVFVTIHFNQRINYDILTLIFNNLIFTILITHIFIFCFKKYGFYKSIFVVTIFHFANNLAKGLAEIVLYNIFTNLNYFF